jgi:hypothetical protein
VVVKVASQEFQISDFTLDSQPSPEAVVGQALPYPTMSSPWEEGLATS